MASVKCRHDCDEFVAGIAREWPLPQPSPPSISHSQGPSKPAYRRQTDVRLIETHATNLPAVARSIQSTDMALSRRPEKGLRSPVYRCLKNAEIFQDFPMCDRRFRDFGQFRISFWNMKIRSDHSVLSDQKAGLEW